MTTIFKRYAIRKTARTEPNSPSYVAIGLGLTKEIEKAHLYTNVGLARKELEKRWKFDSKGVMGETEGHYTHIELIEFTVTLEDTSNVVISRQKP